MHVRTLLLFVMGSLALSGCAGREFAGRSRASARRPVATTGGRSARRAMARNAFARQAIYFMTTAARAAQSLRVARRAGATQQSLPPALRLLQR